MKNQANESLLLVAGGGKLPIALARSLRERGQPHWVLAIKGQASISSFRPSDCREMVPGTMSPVAKLIKENQIKSICFAGSMRQPSIKEIRPDKEMLFFAPQIQKWLLAGGDDSLMRKIIYAAKKRYKLSLAAPHEIIPEWLTPTKTGTLTKAEPKKIDLADIKRGRKVLEHLSAIDVGQTTVVQHGKVLGIEANEGTQALIKRVAYMSRPIKGGVMVKSRKIGQLDRIDMPAIGRNTLKAVKTSGLAGIALEAGGCLMIEAEKLLEDANKLGLFVYIMPPLS